MRLLEFASFGCLIPQANPDRFWVGWGQVIRSESIPRDFLGSVWCYAPSFFLSESQRPVEDSGVWWKFQNGQFMTRSELIEWLNTAIQSSSSCPQLGTPAILGKEFFEEAISEFRNSSLQKIVPVIFQMGAPAPSLEQRLQLILNLLDSTGGTPLFAYGIWDLEGGILGATPEVLLQLDPVQGLRTMALAGTRPRAPSPGHFSSLLECPKNQVEHQWVIQGIQASVESVAYSTPGQTSELLLPTLVHLHTPIRIQPRSSSVGVPFFLELIERLHPTPALGAHPRDQGMAVLERWDSEWKRQFGFSRARFGAPFGAVFNSSAAFCVVAIRNIQWDRHRYFIGAGCGIVGQSDFDSEWAEIQRKLKSVRVWAKGMIKDEI